MREGSELSQEFFPTAYRKRANSSIPRTSSQPSTAVFSPIPKRGKRSEGLDGMMMNSFFLRELARVLKSKSSPRVAKKLK
jgi:hypothetical protein